MGQYTEEITLPSGLVVKVREMTTRDESTLADPKLARKGTALEKVFENCIEFPPGDGNPYGKEHLTPLDLLMGDRYRVIMALRSISYGEIYEFGAECGHCDARGTHEIDLTELEVKELPENQAPGDTFHMTLPRSKQEVEFRLLTGRDEQKIITARRKNPGKVISTVMMLHTVKIDGEPATLSKLEKLGSFDATAYRKELRDKDCGIETEIILDCNECGEEFKSDLPLGTGFFLPMETMSKSPTS